MEEDERQKKVQAGKEKLAELLKKKNSRSKKKKKTDQCSLEEVNEGEHMSDHTATETDESFQSTEEVQQIDQTSSETTVQDMQESLGHIDNLTESAVEENIEESSYKAVIEEYRIKDSDSSGWVLIVVWSNSILHEAGGAFRLLTGSTWMLVHIDNLTESAVEENIEESSYKAVIEEYRIKIREFQNALIQRDDIISQLSERLVTTLENRDAIQADASTQAEALAQEISTLKLQLKQATDVVGKQKSKTGISAQELLETKNQVIFLQQEKVHKDSVIVNLSQRVSSMSSELDILQEEHQTELNNWKETFETNQSLWENKHQQIQCLLKEEQCEKYKLSSQVEELQKQLAENDEHMARLSASLVDNQHKVQELQGLLDDAQNRSRLEIDTLKEESLKKDKKLQAAQAEIEELIQESEMKAQQLIKELEKQKQQNVQSSGAVDQQLTALKVKLEKEHSQNIMTIKAEMLKQLHFEVSAVEQKLQAAIAERNNLNEELKKVKSCSDNEHLTNGHSYVSSHEGAGDSKDQFHSDLLYFMKQCEFLVEQNDHLLQQLSTFKDCHKTQAKQIVSGDAFYTQSNIGEDERVRNESNLRQTENQVELVEKTSKLLVLQPPGTSFDDTSERLEFGLQPLDLDNRESTEEELFGTEGKASSSDNNQNELSSLVKDYFTSLCLQFKSVWIMNNELLQNVRSLRECINALKLELDDEKCKEFHFEFLESLTTPEEILQKSLRIAACKNIQQELLQQNNVLSLKFKEATDGAELLNIQLQDSDDKVKDLKQKINNLGHEEGSYTEIAHNNCQNWISDNDPALEENPQLQETMISINGKRLSQESVKKLERTIELECEGEEPKMTQPKHFQDLQYDHVVSEKDQLSKHLEHLQEKYDQEVSEKHQQSKQLEHLQEKYDQEVSEKDQLSKQLEHLQEKYDQEMSEKHQLSKQLEHLQEKYDQEMSEKNQLDKVEHLEHLQEDYKQVVFGKNKLAEEITNLLLSQQNYDLLVSERDQLLKEVQQLQGLLKETKEDKFENVELQNQYTIADLKSQVDKLSNENDCLKSENKGLNEKLSEYQYQVKELLANTSQTEGEPCDQKTTLDKILWKLEDLTRDKKVAKDYTSHCVTPEVSQLEKSFYFAVPKEIEEKFEKYVILLQNKIYLLENERQDFNKLKEEFQCLETDKMHLEEKLENLETSIGELSKIKYLLADSRRERDMFETKCKELSQELENVHTSEALLRQTLHASYQKRDLENESLKKNLNEYHVFIDQIKSVLLKASTDVAEFAVRNFQFEDISKIIESIQLLTEKLHNSHQTISNLKEKVKKMAELLDQYKNKNNMLLQEIEEKRKNHMLDFDTLKAEIEEKHEAEMQEKVLELEEIHRNELREKEGELINTRDYYTVEMDKLKSELESMQAAKQKLEEQTYELQKCWNQTPNFTVSSQIGEEISKLSLVDPLPSELTVIDKAANSGDQSAFYNIDPKSFVGEDVTEREWKLKYEKLLQKHKVLDCLKEELKVILEENNNTDTKLKELESELKKSEKHTETVVKLLKEKRESEQDLMVQVFNFQEANHKLEAKLEELKVQVSGLLFVKKALEEEVQLGRQKVHSSKMDGLMEDLAVPEAEISELRTKLQSEVELRNSLEASVAHLSKRCELLDRGRNDLLVRMEELKDQVMHYLIEQQKTQSELMNERFENHKTKQELINLQIQLRATQIQDVSEVDNYFDEIVVKESSQTRTDCIGSSLSQSDQGLEKSVEGMLGLSDKMDYLVNISKTIMEEKQKFINQLSEQEQVLNNLRKLLDKENFSANKDVEHLYSHLNQLQIQGEILRNEIEQHTQTYSDISGILSDRSFLEQTQLVVKNAFLKSVKTSEYTPVQEHSCQSELSEEQVAGLELKFLEQLQKFVIQNQRLEAELQQKDLILKKWQQESMQRELEKASEEALIEIEQQEALSNLRRRLTAEALQDLRLLREEMDRRHKKAMKELENKLEMQHSKHVTHLEASHKTQIAALQAENERLQREQEKLTLSNEEAKMQIVSEECLRNHVRRLMDELTCNQKALLENIVLETEKYQKEQIQAIKTKFQDQLREETESIQSCNEKKLQALVASLKLEFEKEKSLILKNQQEKIEKKHKEELNNLKRHLEEEINNLKLKHVEHQRGKECSEVLAERLRDQLEEEKQQHIKTNLSHHSKTVFLHHQTDQQKISSNIHLNIYALLLSFFHFLSPLIFFYFQIFQRALSSTLFSASDFLACHLRCLLHFATFWLWLVSHKCWTFVRGFSLWVLVGVLLGLVNWEFDAGYCTQCLEVRNKCLKELCDYHEIKEKTMVMPSTEASGEIKEKTTAVSSTEISIPSDEGMGNSQLIDVRLESLLTQRELLLKEAKAMHQRLLGVHLKNVGELKQRVLDEYQVVLAVHKEMNAELDKLGKEASMSSKLKSLEAEKSELLGKLEILNHQLDTAGYQNQQLQLLVAQLRKDGGCLNCKSMIDDKNLASGKESCGSQLVSKGTLSQSITSLEEGRLSLFGKVPSEGGDVFRELDNHYRNMYELKIVEYKSQLQISKEELENSYQKRLEAEREKHEKQIMDIECQKTNLEKKYQSDLESLIASHESEKRALEQVYCEKLAEERKKLSEHALVSTVDEDSVNHLFDLEKLRCELEEKFLEEKDMLCKEHVTKVKELITEHTKELKVLQECRKDKNDQMIGFSKDSEADEIRQLTKEKEEILQNKLEIETKLNSQMADLIQEHHDDLQAQIEDTNIRFNEQRKTFEAELHHQLESMKMYHGKEMQLQERVLKEKHEETCATLEEEHKKQLKELKSSHSTEIQQLQAMIEEQKMTSQKQIEDLKTNHSLEVDALQHKIEDLLKKNRDLFSKHFLEMEEVSLFYSNESRQMSNKLRAKIEEEKHSYLSDLQSSFFFLNRENLRAKHCNVLSSSISEEDLRVLKENQKVEVRELHEHFKIDLEKAKVQAKKEANKKEQQNEAGMLKEMEKLRLKMEMDMAVYASENERLARELEELRDHIHLLSPDDSLCCFFFSLKKEKQIWNIRLGEQKIGKRTCETYKLTSTGTTTLPRDWQTGTELSTNDIQSWQVDTAQTNSRLLNVLSHLVKTFLDTEQDIQNHLTKLGLDAGYLNDGNQDDDHGTAASHGSKEDFSNLSLGEGLSLELTEDGPDLTPRTWEFFNSTVPPTESDTEGEDVVLGASYRLKAAVEKVLNILTELVEAQQNQDFCELLKRNEDLVQELREEGQAKDFLRMELIKTESSMRNVEMEKVRLEDSVHILTDTKIKQTKEIGNLKAQIQELEHSQETLSEDRKLLEEQRYMLASSLGDPEQKLLQENSKLATEKRNLQKQHDRERQRLLARIHQLELTLEEFRSEQDEMLEQKRREMEDLKSQMEAMEKQLQYHKKFIEEQALEREQERDEYLKEVSKLQELVKEKERIQNSEDRLTKEVEALEQQLRARIEDHKEVLRKREQIETELHHTSDKIHDLRDVIRELELELDIKSRTEKDLNQQIVNLKETMSDQEKAHLELSSEVEQLRNSSSRSELNSHVRLLEEQLETRGQQLERMMYCQSILQEFKAQIQSLEEKVENKTQQLEVLHLPIFSVSSVQSESKDSHHLTVTEEIRELSPASLDWEELRRLDDKIEVLIKAEEELMMRNKELERQLKKAKLAEEEEQHEKLALQEQVNNQLLQISALKARIEEQRHGGERGSPFLVGSEAFRQLGQLREALIKEQEQREEVERKLQTVNMELEDLQKQVKEKCDSIEELEIQLETANSTNSEITNTKKDLACLTKENEELTTELKMLKIKAANAPLPHYIQMLLDDKNEEIDQLNNQIELLKKELKEAKIMVKSETLMPTMSFVSVNKNRFNSVSQIETGGSMSVSDELFKTKEEAQELQQIIENQTKNLENKDRVLAEKELGFQKTSDSLYGQIVSLNKEAEEKDNKMLVLKKENDALQTQVNSLLEEVESLNQYQLASNILEDNSLHTSKRLQEDFDTVQRMLEENQEELNTLNEEAETQVKLESEILTLKNLLEDEKQEHVIQREQLKQEVEQLNEHLDMVHKDHENVVAQLKKELEVLSSGHSHTQETLRQEILKLREEFVSQDKESPGLEKITMQFMEMLSSLKQDVEKSKVLLSAEIIRQVAETERETIHKEQLQKAEESCQKEFDEDCRKVNNDFQNKLKEFEFELRDKFEKEKSELELNHKMKISEIENKLKYQFERDKEEEIQKVESSWVQHTEVMKQIHEDELQALKKSHEDELQASEKMHSTALENAKKHLNDYHQEDIAALRKTLEDAFHREEEMLQKNHEDDIRYLQENWEKKFEAEQQNLHYRYQHELHQLKESIARKYEMDLSALQMIHHEQFQKLSEDTSEHWKPQMSDLQRLRCKEIELTKENLCRQFEHEKMKMKEIHAEEINNIRESNEKSLEDLKNNFVLTYGDKSEHAEKAAASTLESEKQSLSHIHSFELQKLSEEYEKRIEHESLKYKQKYEDELKHEKDKIQGRFSEEWDTMQETHRSKIREVREKAWNELKSVREQLETKHWETVRQLEEHLTLQHKMEQLEREKKHQEEMKNLEAHMLQQLEENKSAMQRSHQEEVEGLREALRSSKQNSPNPYRETSTSSSDGTSKYESGDPPSEYSSDFVGESDKVLPPEIKKLLQKVYIEGTQVLSLTEHKQLQSHVASSLNVPPGKTKELQYSEKEKQLYIEELQVLKSLMKEELVGDKGKEILVNVLNSIFKQQREKLKQDLEEHVDVTDNVKRKMAQLEKDQKAALKNLAESLLKELSRVQLTLKHERNQHYQAFHHLEQQNINLEDQKSRFEWQIKTQKELLEFRAKQEKALADDLRSSLEAEKSRNGELVSKLNEQRSNCLRLENALSSLEDKLSQLRQASVEDKKQIENYVEIYEKEKSHSQTLLKALESERSNFTQLQLVLESERRRSKTVHEHNSQIIQDLKKSLNSSEGGNFSPMSTPCDVEKLRGGDVNRSLGVDLSNTLHLQATPVDEQKSLEKPCIRCNTLEMERTLWVQEQSKLQQSLHKAESEVIRLRLLLQTVGEESDKATLTSLENKVHKLYFKYRRAESYRRGLIYQKKYLMSLLGGYQATESATLVMLAKISGDEVTANHQTSLPPISVFRSAVYAIIALQRMKYLMNRWNKVTNIHSSYSLQEPERLTHLGSPCQSSVPHGIGLPTAVVGVSVSSISSQPTIHAGNHNKLFTSKLHSPVSGHSPLPLPTPTGSRSISPSALPVSAGGTSGSSQFVNNVYLTPPVREKNSSFIRSIPSHDLSASSTKQAPESERKENGKLGGYLTRLYKLHKTLGLDTENK
ncbi:LOW QUALITY PROTEIN: uncharacterized protein LOC143235747 [Tachypleus tridentatus]|uniref:LOW QUALITY PROTEIN: uncharacterized protein LOC143235747 n=1 Tax=Tachypleus tridentatus TaxID=6853 RepID=UPI003FD27282